MREDETWDEHPGLKRYIKLKRPNVDDIEKVLEDFSIDSVVGSDRRSVLLIIMCSLGKLPVINRSAYVSAIIKVMELIK